MNMPLQIGAPIYVHPVLPGGSTGLTGHWFYTRRSLDGGGLCLARSPQEAHAGEWSAIISVDRCEPQRKNFNDQR